MSNISEEKLEQILNRNIPTGDPALEHSNVLLARSFIRALKEVIEDLLNE